jgi:hypothetical protein
MNSRLVPSLICKGHGRLFRSKVTNSTQIDGSPEGVCVTGITGTEICFSTQEDTSQFFSLRRNVVCIKKRQVVKRYLSLIKFYF